MNPFTNVNSPDTIALKARYLECFGTRASTGESLRETVRDLVELGVSRSTLIAWAMQTGCTKGYASSLVSRILCKLGLRKRRIGAGRKPSADALNLLAYAQAKFGRQTRKVLRAAWRVANAQAETPVSQSRLGLSRTKELELIVVPLLGANEGNCGSTIRESRNTKVNGHGHPQSVSRNVRNLGNPINQGAL